MPLTLDELSGRKVGIWGAGREGIAATKALASLADPPELVVAAADIQPEQAEAIRAVYPDASLFAGPNPQKELARCEVVVRSAGVSIYGEAFRELVAAGVEVTTGTNLWFAGRPQVISVGITGTKGKSTTSSLTAHLLRTRFRVVLAGNIGVPLLETLDEADAEVYVIELSSHQVSDLELRPTISVLLNLLPEHLQWHGSWRRYYDDKVRLLEHDTKPIANHASPVVREAVEARGLEVVWFNAAETIRAADDGIWRGESRLYDKAALSLSGVHNHSNAAAALTVAAVLGFEVPSLSVELATFQPLPHRLERVGEFGGRVFVNDSSSTTPESTVAALEALDEASEVVLVAGGVDREQNYEELARRIANDRRVRAVVGLPNTGQKLLTELRMQDAGRGLHLLTAPTVEEAVSLAVDVSHRGATILLSPAAPSYGTYRDFAERGERFARAAHDSASKPSGPQSATR